MAFGLPLPDKWFVRRIKESTNEQAWWIAANPKRGIGKVFHKDDWEQANAWAAEQAALHTKLDALDGE